MFVLVYSVWIGALVASVMKLASPHRSLTSWLFVGLVGALGGILGLYVGRMMGLDDSKRAAGYVCVGLSAAAVTMLYAAISRRVYRKRLRVRPTRPTIVF